MTTSNQVAYLGHAGSGGLQRHSIGAEYPYTIIGVCDSLDAPVEWQVLDTRTGNLGHRRLTYNLAAQDLWALKIRNMMHS